MNHETTIPPAESVPLPASPPTIREVVLGALSDESRRLAGGDLADPKVRQRLQSVLNLMGTCSKVLAKSDADEAMELLGSVDEEYGDDGVHMVRNPGRFVMGVGAAPGEDVMTRMAREMIALLPRIVDVWERQVGNGRPGGILGILQRNEEALAPRPHVEGPACPCAECAEEPRIDAEFSKDARSALDQAHDALYEAERNYREALRNEGAPAPTTTVTA